MNRSLTLKYDKISRTLHTQCGIALPKNPNGAVDTSGVVNFTGLWDTGATNCSISKNVVAALGLVPTGYAKVSHANGDSRRNTYLISVFLPNGVVFPFLPVIEADLNGFDVLIGMDIITQGDFSITNHHQKTCMSFRMPSCHEVDYYKHPDKRFNSDHLAGVRGSNFTKSNKNKKGKK